MDTGNEGKERSQTYFVMGVPSRGWHSGVIHFCVELGGATEGGG